MFITRERFGFGLVGELFTGWFILDAYESKHHACEVICLSCFWFVVISVLTLARESRLALDSKGESHLVMLS
jgi:hypothetical protein